jgi:hypothetical protein
MRVDDGTPDDRSWRMRSLSIGSTSTVFPGALRRIVLQNVARKRRTESDSNTRATSPAAMLPRVGWSSPSSCWRCVLGRYLTQGLMQAQALNERLAPPDGAANHPGRTRTRSALEDNREHRHGRQLWGQGRPANIVAGDANWPLIPKRPLATGERPAAVS